MITFQEILRRLSQFWESQGCIAHQGYDLEMGAGTFNPATFLRCFGPEPYNAAYIEPCRRPTDGRYGTNPNRVQHYYQYQVVLKPSPYNIQELYLKSLEALGVDLSAHDIRFIHDDWESPTLGAWGLGWEVWMDGMEITQFTYFQSVGGQSLKPVMGEITYGVERIAMYLQKVDNLFDLKWNDDISYGDIYHRNEVEWSHYNFEDANVKMWSKHFDDYEGEAKRMVEKGLPIPAYDFVMKASHAFNLLDARGAISVSERTGYIGRIRNLAKLIAESYIESREIQGFPLLNKFQNLTEKEISVPQISDTLRDVSSDKKVDFLLEVGSEELPDSFVPVGMGNLSKQVKKLLDTEGILYNEIEVFGTPRRLTLIVKEMVLAIPEQQTERKGPAVQKAFDDHGTPLPAATGFFKSIGIEPKTLSELKDSSGSVTVKEIKGVDYLFANVVSPSRASAEILSKKLPDAILKVEFPKSMRWGSLDISYARPLRWIVALAGDEVIPFVVGNVLSGRTSHGHRQLCNKAFDIKRSSNYLSAVREHYVMVDPNERKSVINSQLDNLEKEIGAKIIAREKTLPAVVNILEWPEATVATFDPKFLSAPKEVLISEMVEHQKYFPVAQEDGTLKNLFIITADTRPTDEIREGNQKVLSARLSDGVFLYEKDLKVPFESFNEKLKTVTYIKGLGTLYDKVVRLQHHVKTLCRELRVNELDECVRAATLSKADLASNMVYEFPELQGTIGKYYAEIAGERVAVSQAIEEQWMPKGEGSQLPQSEVGTILSLADKIDNIMSCFVADLKPTSSSDPYALRRQALGIIRIVIDKKLRLPLQKVLEECSTHYDKSINVSNLVSDIEEFFVNRIKTVFVDYGLSHDEVEASVAHGFTDIYDTYCRVKALHDFRCESGAFSALYEVYKRAKGQLNGFKSMNFKSDKLKETAEIHLSEVLNQTKTPFESALKGCDYDKAYSLVAEIQPVLGALFDEVLILHEDESIRNNRIALLQRVFTRFDKLLDFSKIREKS